jgi:endoglucanase
VQRVATSVQAGNTSLETAGMAMFDLVKTLTELPGPVGIEDRVQAWIADRWSAFAEVRRTHVGNVLARVGGHGPRLLLAAHADEICLMVKSISDDGFLHLWPYYNDRRGRPPRWFSPSGQPALVVTGSDTLEGVFASASGHVIGGQGSGRDKTGWNDWWVDLGLRSGTDAAWLGIHPGCRVIWNPPTRRLRGNIVGKAMDDRAALAIVTAAAERLAGRTDPPFELWIASTVQEENGLVGASSLLDEERFDQCIAVDVGLTGDIPGVDRLDFPAKLGAGPIVVYADSSCHYSLRLGNALVEVAERASIPVQQAIFQHYGSDGAAVLRRGVETILLTYPTRYTHSPIETVDEADLTACVDLIVAYASGAR